MTGLVIWAACMVVVVVNTWTVWTLRHVSRSMDNMDRRLDKLERRAR